MSTEYFKSNGIAKRFAQKRLTPQIHQNKRTAGSKVVTYGPYKLEYYEEGGHNLWTLTLSKGDNVLWDTSDYDEIKSLFEDGFIDFKNPKESIEYLLQFSK